MSNVPAPRPLMVVEDAHVSYRVFASGKRMTARDSLLSAGALRGGRGLHTVQALRGVSFTASEGETIGVVGHNGSGKSTLFRAMTGLIPTESGSIRAADRPVLLGVNAALVPELSGENNIKLGLLAMGFTPDEAASHVDEIADFAELNEFLYHPMRTYSAGMGARLRFAIASARAHSILLVDEALAVGDRRFRAKSEKRIRELRESAGLVMIVSHSAGSLRDTCERVLWIHKGELREDGPAHEVLRAYGQWTKQPGGAAVGAASVTKAPRAAQRPAGVKAAPDVVAGSSGAESSSVTPAAVAMSSRDVARRERFYRDQRQLRRKRVATVTATAAAVLIAVGAGAAIAVLGNIAAPPPAETAGGRPLTDAAPHILSFSATDAAAACLSEEGETEVRLAWEVEGAAALALASGRTVTDAINAPLRDDLSSSEGAYAVPFPCTEEQRVYTLTAEGADGSHISSVVVVERAEVPTPEPTIEDPEGEPETVAPWWPIPADPAPVDPAPVEPDPVTPAPVEPSTPPTVPPVEPTLPPVEPTLPPVEPPIEPTLPPVEPAPDLGDASQS